jgi:2,3-bisphosphoglycerate-independent phosphoglycerate mutase
LKKGKQPANFLATQRCGRRVLLESFNEKWGFSGLLVASGAVFKGLARELGIDFIAVRDSENPEKDLRDRIRLALSDQDHNFIHIHTKAPDEAAHRGSPEHKRDVINALDRGLDEIMTVAENPKELLVAITADHSTSSVPLRSIHSGEPVPAVIVGPHVRRDGVSAFDEMEAAKGCLGFMKGKDLLLNLVNYANRAGLVGHQLGRTLRLIAPTDYPPFKCTD